jgi:hypothetical protein
MKIARLRLRLGLMIGIVVGTSVALIELAERGLPPFEPPVEPPVQAAPANVGETGTADRSASAVAEPDWTAKLVAPELEVQTIPGTAAVVDSFPPTRHVPLRGWFRSDSPAGHFDGLYRADSRQIVRPDEAIDGNATLLASGWSGDPQLGLRMHDVVLSQCDRIVARTHPSIDRPDVADAVHPNLDRSGWEATIHAADLAICADPTLRAWAVLPGRPTALLPLNGAHRIAAVEPAEQPADHVSALPPLEAADLAPPVVSVIDIAESRVDLRRCGRPNCRTVGHIDRGRHRVHVADRRDGWSLLVFGDRAGWMADKFYMLAE